MPHGVALYTFAGKMLNSFASNNVSRVQLRWIGGVQMVFTLFTLGRLGVHKNPKGRSSSGVKSDPFVMLV